MVNLSLADDDGESAVDRISGLHDALLLHILSFLVVDDVVKTSLLSKRWKNLWASATALNLDVCTTKRTSPHYFIADVNAYLMLHEGQQIRKFRARLVYRKMQHVYMDAWFLFLKRRGVEEIDLDYLYSWPPLGITDQCERCLICNSMFDCKKLKVLSLASCNVDPAACFRFKLLKNLKLKDVNISNLDLSCCPLLECLTLISCNERGTLDINAPNPKFRSLQLTDSRKAWDAKLVLYAPHVLFVELCHSLRLQYHIGELSHIKKASFCIETFEVARGGDQLHKLIGIMKNFRHAQTFVLSNPCIKAFAHSTTENLDIAFLNVVALEVDTDLRQLDVWVMMHVLSFFPHVDFLIFNVCLKCNYISGPFYGETFAERKVAWKCLEKLLVSTASGIKNIRINNFLWDKRHCYLFGHYFNISDLVDIKKLVSNEKLEPLELWLRCCSILKVMDIKIAKTIYFRNSMLKSDLLLHLNNTLQCLPKASTIAQISVSYKILE
ncbi:F-box/FBD/LRR-repeat protein [Apostasia shenzhenica]|uniref:F-box/FBD/LRR-repeat protein n=1 Tax=Apostasia shenzhenica TaxID=1088818 RepID=A0A2I0AID7_9ASPA|nr:F-box/FBD/LRR-repeat protein [Apostasia shenzhenica]